MWDRDPTNDELLADRLATGWKPTPSRLKSGDVVLGHAACVLPSLSDRKNDT